MGKKNKAVVEEMILHLSGSYFVPDNTPLGFKDVKMCPQEITLTEELLKLEIWSEKFWDTIEEWFRTKVDNKCIQFNHWTTHGWLEFKELCG